MKNSGKNMMKLTMIILILVIAILIGIIIKISSANRIINKQEENVGQQLETTSENAYVSMETHLSELNNKQKEIDNMQSTAGQANVTADKILKDYKAYSNGKLITGTMANNGAVNQTLNAGGSYTIPAGYHNGSGKVKVNSLESQTSATATAAQILTGQTAWVKGSKVTGTMANRGAVSQTLKGGGSYTIPAGYHNGNGKVTVTNVIKTWCPNYGDWVNYSSVYTTDTYSVNATSLYVLVRVENGGTTAQYSAPSCSDGTVTTLVNSGNALLYHISKTASATFTLGVYINRNYNTYPNSTLRVYAFIPQ